VLPLAQHLRLESCAAAGSAPVSSGPASSGRHGGQQDAEASS
jgi:hypothetical protein